MSEFLRVFNPINFQGLETARQLLFLALFSTAGGATYIEWVKHNKSKVEKIAKAALENRNSLKNIMGEDGLTLSKQIQLTEKFDFEGSLIFGPTGAGKTTGFFFPNLLSNNIKGSIIVTDPKSELFEKTSRYQEVVCGRKVYKFSPLEPYKSERYNLLENCKDATEICQLADSLLNNGSLSIELSTGKKTGGAEWIQMASPLLSAALIYAYHQSKPLNCIEFALKLILSLETKELEYMFYKSKIHDCITQWNIFKTVAGADRTEGSIKITLSTNMRLFTDPKINYVCGDTTFNFDKFREEPSILYITYPERKSSYLAPFIAPFLDQMFSTLIEQYNQNSLPIHFFSDEFANIGQINNLTSIVSTVRSRKISMNLCLQSLSQLNQVYGKEITKSVMNNLKTKIVLPGLSDEETLNHISNICGKREIQIKSRSINSALSASETYSKTAIKVFEPSDIRCLGNEEVLIVTSNKNPVVDEINTYYKQEKYTKNIGSPLKLTFSSKNQARQLNNVIEEYKQMIKNEKAAARKNKYNVKKTKSIKEELNDILN